MQTRLNEIEHIHLYMMKKDKTPLFQDILIIQINNS